MNNDTFQWTDLLACEWAGYLEEQLKVKSIIDMQSILFQWKQSKMPKKEWEIVDCFDNKGNKLSWHPYDKDCNGFKCEIHSVRRLSDNEVFTVGDFVKWAHHDPFNITAFRIGLSNEMFCVDSQDLSYHITEVKKEQPKKERIEVERIQDITYGSSNNNTLIVTTSRINPDKYESIKAAIERVLNDDEAETKVYTKEDCDILVEAAQSTAFSAARETYAGHHCNKYISFQDYLNHQRDKK